MVTMEALPTVKVLLHAAKHPHAAVCGILLGTMKSSNSALIIDDAIPLFHHTTMNPLMETAFMLVEQYAIQSGKLPVGVYYAPAEVTSFVPSVDTVPPQLRVAVEQMRAHYPNPGAMFVTIDNRSLADRQASPFHAYAKFAGSWTVAASFHVSQKGLMAFNSVVSGGRSGKAGAELEACRSLVDMDEHLDDARKDFRNPQIAELLSLVS